MTDYDLAHFCNDNIWISKIDDFLICIRVMSTTTTPTPSIYGGTVEEFLEERVKPDCDVWGYFCKEYTQPWHEKQVPQ
jgi:hypothetical protein